ncbi:MAG: NAD(P)-binding protein [Actinomycetota bacterium]
MAGQARRPGRDRSRSPSPGGHGDRLGGRGRPVAGHVLVADASNDVDRLEIIVGGGPTGLTTAIYAARENLETLIVDSKGLGARPA